MKVIIAFILAGLIIYAIETREQWMLMLGLTDSAPTEEIRTGGINSSTDAIKDATN